MSEITWKPVGELGLAARTDVPVMVAATSSVQRRAFARYIHDSGIRHRQPFVAVSFSSDSSGGTGWFTVSASTITNHAATVSLWFERAAGGTLFLDDLAGMSAEVQQELCDSLSSPLGVRGYEYRVRIISGTRPAWPTLAERGHFSDRLYYRLNVLRLDCGAMTRDRVPTPRQAAAALAWRALSEPPSVARLRTARGR